MSNKPGFLSDSDFEAIHLLTFDFEDLCALNPVFKTIRERRSVRLFESRGISDDVIKNLIQAAQWSPSAWDTQSCRFVVVRDEEKRGLIFDAVLSVMQESRSELIDPEEHRRFLGVDAPVQIFVCNDTRNIRDERVRKESRIVCYAAIQNLLLAAHALELGSCWQGDPILGRDTIKSLLRIPDGVEIISSVALGHSMETPYPPQRKHDLSDILFWENMA